MREGKRASLRQSRSTYRIIKKGRRSPLFPCAVEESEDKLLFLLSREVEFDFLGELLRSGSAIRVPWDANEPEVVDLRRQFFASPFPKVIDQLRTCLSLRSAKRKMTLPWLVLASLSLSRKRSFSPRSEEKNARIFISN